MALSSGSAERKRLLPGTYEAGLKRMAWRAAGAGLVALALAGWLSLATWSIHDPSLNHATRDAPANLFATWGAVTADLSIQSIGLAAIALFLPLAAWGRHIALAQAPSQVHLRLAAWPIAVMLLAGGLSALPEPESWPLPNGFGGIMGDLTLAAARLVLAPLPGVMVRGLAAILFLATGIAALLYASGISPAALALLRGEPVQRDPEARSLAYRALRTAGAMLASLFRLIRNSGEAHAEDNAASDYDAETLETPDGGYNLNADSELDDSLPRFLRREQAAADASGRIEPYFTSKKTPAMTPGGGQDGGCAGHYTITRRAQARPVRMTTRNAQSVPAGLSANFSLPPLRLLKKPPASRRGHGVTDKILQENARLLEDVMQDFGVKGEITNVSPGPIVTLYEL
ncbi:MAG: DNA translocase FtsK 4TM domain-containing protein, partial [Methyloligellaceae bacterium]